MNGGIDIGRETVVIATPERTTHYSNTIRELDDESVEESTPVVETGSKRFAVGGATDESVTETDSRPLFGDSGASELPTDLKRGAIEVLLDDARGTATGERSEEDNWEISYVDRTADDSSGVTAAFGHGFSAEATDPGIAVCYDVFGETPTGLGIAIGEGRAFATLAVEGIPVASAQHSYEGMWYDVSESAALLGRDGLKAAWARIQYETLFEKLSSQLASTAPALEDPIAVAIGGSAAPVDIRTDDLSVVGKILRVEIASVTVADEPADALARGALTARRAASDVSGAVPIFAAATEYAAGLADIGAAADAFAGTTERKIAETVGTGGTDQTTQWRSDRTGNSDSSKPTGDTVESYRDDNRVASILGRLIQQGAIDDSENKDVSAVSEDLRNQLDELEQQTASADELDELAASIPTLTQHLDELDDDIREIRAVLSGLSDDDAVSGLDMSDALESMALDTLQDDIDAVDAALSRRTNHLQSELDDINNELVDIAAEMRGLPDLEDDIESTDETVRELSNEINQVQASVDDVHAQVETLEDEVVEADQLETLADDLEAVTEDLETLTREFETVDRVDPKQIDDLQGDFDALRGTVLNHAQRLEGVERTTSDLDNRLEQAFQNTAKAEALSSLQTEVNRIRESTASAQERASSAVATATEIEETVDTVQSDIKQVQTMADTLAKNSATRSEMDETVRDIEARLDELEAGAHSEQPTPQQTPTRPFQIAAVGLASVGLLGALLAVDLEQTATAAAFVALVVGPAVWLWLSLPET